MIDKKQCKVLKTCRFLVPCKARGSYIQKFSQLVHECLDTMRTAHFERDGEVWNDMFDAPNMCSAKARRESLEAVMQSTRR